MSWFSVSQLITKPKLLKYCNTGIWNTIRLLIIYNLWHDFIFCYPERDNFISAFQSTHKLEHFKNLTKYLKPFCISYAQSNGAFLKNKSFCVANILRISTKPTPLCSSSSLLSYKDNFTYLASLFAIFSIFLHIFYSPAALQCYQSVVAEEQIT